MTNLSHYLRMMLTAWFPFGILLISYPLLLVESNPTELYLSLGDFKILSGLAALCALSLLIIMFCLPRHYAERLSIILLSIGVYFLLSDILTPLETGPLFHGLSPADITQSSLEIIVDSILLLVIVIFFLKIPRENLFQFATIMAMVFFSSQLFLSANPLWKIGGKPTQEAHANHLPINSEDKKAPRKYVYHLVFDTYSSLVFPESLKQLNLSKQDFSGFYFFENARSNFLNTNASMQTVLTGTHYTGGSFKSWSNSHATGGIFKTMAENGLNPKQYAFEKAGNYRPYTLNSHVETIPLFRPQLAQVGDSKAKAQIAAQWENLLTLADLSLLRAMPSALRPASIKDGRGLASNLLRGVIQSKGYFETDLVRHFITAAQKADPGYHYLHVMLPHSPYKENRACQDIRDLNSEQSSPSTPKPIATQYIESSLCTTKLIVELIAALKDAGIYREATIVIQSDHGYGGALPSQFSLKTKYSKTYIDSLAKKLLRREDGMTRRDRRFHAQQYVDWSISNQDEFLAIGYAYNIDQVTRALLLIKPSGHDQVPMRISAAPVQLSDVPATLADILDIHNDTDGISVLSNNIDPGRNLSIFVGIYQHNKKGDLIQYPFGYEEGYLNHILLQHTNDWSMGENIFIPSEKDINRIKEK